MHFKLRGLIEITKQLAVSVVVATRHNSFLSALEFNTHELADITGNNLVFHLGAVKLKPILRSILLDAVCICAMLGTIMITHTTEEVSNLFCSAITGL